MQVNQKGKEIMATLEGIMNTITEMRPELHPVSQDVVKNTVTMKGLCLKTEGSNIAPCIYVDSYLDSDISDEEAAEQIIATYNQSGIDIDPNLFLCKDYILEHTYVGLQRRDEGCAYITRESEWPDIIEYMYVRAKAESGEACSVKITDALLTNIGIEADELWLRAEEATKAEISIQSMAEALGLTDMCDTEMDVPFYIISNTLRVNGAATALNGDYIREWARKKGFAEGKLVLIFSSIHEALILPATDEMDLDYFDTMIREVNSTEVQPQEQLADKAYIINL